MNKIELKGKEVREFTVKGFGDSGHIIVPKKYIGKKVMIVFS